MKSLSFMVVLMIVVLVGCVDQGANPVQPSYQPVSPPPPNPVAATISFSKNVLPIFAAYGCEGCHGGTSGLFVGSVAQLKQGGLHGPAIVTGNSSASNLIKKLSSTPSFGVRMPEGGPYLPDSTLQVIKEWIDQGALDN